MGAWGTGPFDNDDANDFAEEVGAKDDLVAVEGALDKVLASGGDFLQAPEASKAVAAAEILTLLAERPSEETEYPDQIEEWAAESEHVPSDALLAKAVRALDRILTPPSELLALWSEGEDLAEWKASLEDAKRRLAPPPP
jgi:Domain of unknown function (DUF4259)